MANQKENNDIIVLCNQGKSAFACVIDEYDILFRFHVISQVHDKLHLALVERIEGVEKDWGNF
jgi:hypothetical protein